MVCVGIAGAVGALVGAILVLATRDFGFSVDVEQLYDAAFADRDQPEIYLLRIAESHRQRRVANRDGVENYSASLSVDSSESCSRSRVSRRPSPYTEGMATTPQSAPKPPATPAPQPPKIEPYPNIFFVEGKALGAPGERRSD